MIKKRKQEINFGFSLNCDIYAYIHNIYITNLSYKL